MTAAPSLSKSQNASVVLLWPLLCLDAGWWPGSPRPGPSLPRPRSRAGALRRRRGPGKGLGERTAWTPGGGTGEPLDLTAPPHAAWQCRQTRQGTHYMHILGEQHVFA